MEKLTEKQKEMIKSIFRNIDIELNDDFLDKIIIKDENEKNKNGKL